MKAAILSGPNMLSVNHLSRPVCPAGGLLVRVVCCAICSSDARMVLKGHQGLVYPRIPGHELSGVVDESRNSCFVPGDRVQIYPGLSCGHCSACRRGEPRRCISLKTMGFSADGGFAEYISLEESSITSGGVNLIPRNVSDSQAALSEPLASCINAQEKARVGQGDTVLILGAGPLGLLHSRLARHLGAARILITEIDDRRLELAGELAQADRVINIGMERIPQVISDETGSRGVNVILLASNALPVVNLLPLLVEGGRLSLFAGISKDLSFERFDINQIHYRELEVTGAFGSTPAQNTTALDLIAGGFPVEDLITKTLSIDEISAGIEHTNDHQGLRAMVCFNA
ncbi:MAG: alcohol dehydrogenase catalytic domain-containing protein [Dehalogenimonas sp.]|uniref:Alcohol dehydrogenase catalytic domain-containing protein n=1 Tax=Candidatus Dehalogenimonas loeffleri TaxID=3127115 RepID=A0ABZ2J4M0_9CHLR|nr:alcohol dehydrogenase catalytic domain-containing protein [Dehalogenimonas sp.]